MSPTRLPRSLAAIGAALLCAAAQAQTASLPQPVELKGLSTAFVAGNVIGSVASGAACTATTEREWSELLSQRIAAELPQVFREQVGTAGAHSGQPLEVTAFLNDMNVQICNTGHGAWQGSVYVQTNWQVTSAQSKRVIYQASTQGLSSAQGTSATSGLREALTVAVRNLLADKRFVASLAQEGESSQLALLERR